VGALLLVQGYERFIAVRLQRRFSVRMDFVLESMTITQRQPGWREPGNAYDVRTVLRGFE